MFHVFLLADDFISNHSIWKNYVSSNYDPDQSDCPNILSGLIWVQTVFKCHYTTLVGAALNLQRQLLSDLNSPQLGKLKGLPCVCLFVRLKK